MQHVTMFLSSTLGSDLCEHIREHSIGFKLSCVYQYFLSVQEVQKQQTIKSKLAFRSFRKEGELRTLLYCPIHGTQRKFLSTIIYQENDNRAAIKHRCCHCYYHLLTIVD
jgi:hypothetical protein